MNKYLSIDGKRQVVMASVKPGIIIGGETFRLASSTQLVPTVTRLEPTITDQIVPAQVRQVLDQVVLQTEVIATDMLGGLPDNRTVLDVPSTGVRPVIVVPAKQSSAEEALARLRAKQKVPQTTSTAQ